MPPKKAKAQKMALAEFFADTASGSWADDMDLPTAPSAKDPNAGPRSGERGYLDSMPDRGARGNFPGAPQGREELPLPTAPPYTAYIGNLTFESSEDEVREHFGDLKPTAVRLVKDDTGRSKGFGYVEFPDVEALKGALERSNTQLGGRTIRVSVASAPSGPRREPSAAEESNQWRRSGPLPVREPPPSARRGPSFTGAPGGGEDRDWGAARGAKFTPAPPSPLGPMRRDSSGPGRERSMEPSAADEVSQWRSAKPMVEISRDASGQSSPNLADTEATWSRGTKLRTPVVEAPNRSSNNSPDERDWRSSRGASAAPSQPSRQGSADIETPAAPVERRKLNLAPRSVPATPSTANTETSTPPATRASIFGGAKPVDSATREKEAEEKMAARAAERRAEAAKAKEEEERKIKELADERQRSIKEAQEKARAEFGGPAPDSNGPSPSVRGGRGGARGTNGPARGGRGGPARTPSGGAQARSPTSPRAKYSQTAGEDGFEGVVRGSGNRMAPPVPKSSPPVTEKKKEPAKTTRQGFSFAAAMKAGGFGDDEGGDEEEEEEEGANGKDEVEEVRKGVEGIAA